MSDPVLVIFGSARGDGTTKTVLDTLFKDKPIDLIDLNSLSISYFDYDHKNINDDFLLVANKMIASSTIVFVTPVYWYAMSAVMKTFFDRFSDLVSIKKELGRQLKGKKTYLVASGAGQSLPEGFEVPFLRTSEYLDMDFCGSFYHSVTQEKTFNEACKSNGITFVNSIFD